MPESFAEAKGRLIRAWDVAGVTPVIFRLEPAPEGTPEGFAAWRVGERAPFSIVVLPMIDPTVSDYHMSRYILRIIATATGHCGACGRLAEPTADPETSRGFWLRTPVTVQVMHDEGCPATFTEDDRHLFPIFREDES